MKEIKMTQGKTTLVDDTDYDWLVQWKWRAKRNGNTWYAARSSKRDANNKQKTINMHRQILGITDPKIFGEHKDGDGLNNQRYNLREATNKENQHNQRQKQGGTSKYKGVYWNKKQEKWKAHIRLGDASPAYLGVFENETDAAIAYNKAATKHYGEFARLNIINQ